MKRIVAMILAAALCLGLFASFAYAAEGTEKTFKVGVILYDILDITTTLF